MTMRLPDPIHPESPAGKLFNHLADRARQRNPLEKEMHPATGPDAEGCKVMVGVFRSADPRYEAGILCFTVNDDQDTEPSWGIVPAHTRAEAEATARRFMAAHLSPGDPMVQDRCVAPGVHELSVWNV